MTASMTSDELNGDEGRDTLIGADGDDVLFGDVGDDILDGGDAPRTTFLDPDTVAGAPGSTLDAVGLFGLAAFTAEQRTKEIGIRIAVGARTWDIRWQFIMEAMTLSVIGGFVGIALGFGASRTLANLANWSTQVSPEAVGMAVAFSAIVGLFFGAWPARRAASLDPIEALRYE